MTIPINQEMDIIDFTMPSDVLNSFIIQGFPRYSMRTTSFTRIAEKYANIQESYHTISQLPREITLDAPDWVKEVMSSAQFGDNSLLIRESHNSRFFRIKVVVNSPKMQITGPLNILAVGASIQHGIYDNEEHLEDLFAAKGVYAKIFDRAVGGTKSATTLSTLSTHIAEVQQRDGVNFMTVHTNGNDLTSAFEGYPTAAASMEANFRGIIQAGLAAQFEVLASPISYRIPPASMPAEEYNSNHMLPAIQELTPNWVEDGQPVYNLHKWTFEHPEYNLDGIHMTDPGRLVAGSDIVDLICDRIEQTIPETQYIEDVVVRFNSGAYHSKWMGRHRNSISAANTPIELYNRNGTKVTGATLEIDDGFFGGKNGYAGHSSSDISLLNYALNKENCSTDMAHVTLVDGLDPSASYEVSMTGSRAYSTSTTRVGKYTVGAQSGNIQCAVDLLDPAIPEILTFTGVTVGEIGTLLLTIEAEVGSTTGYINGLRIRKE
ncbi:SGNH hydrolase-type esterase domain protein [Vibrio phage 1.081.O._10N.286.52.C2]|nr:SGNH hydrolase-type esterase domain protein [Vibrio phage 1.081.O._10N.286.52.C2]